MRWERREGGLDRWECERMHAGEVEGEVVGGERGWIVYRQTDRQTARESIGYLAVKEEPAWMSAILSFSLIGLEKSFGSAVTYVL